MMMIS